ncbi:MAG: phage major capsid protein [Oscillospiraceae bacterium]|nr:phage major capsid protein [Oscillospiraceae bacterium]
MSLKEELAQLKGNLAALKERIEADDQEAIAEGVQLKAKIEEKEAAIEAAEKKAGLLNVIGTKEEEDSTVEEKKTALEEFTAKAAATDKNVKGWSVNAHIKAATTVVTGSTMTDYDRSVAPQPKRVAAADFFANAIISGNAITYFRQGAYEGSPAVTAEGGKKPQNSTSFTPTTLPLSKIAAYIKETDEILWDQDFLASEVQNSLIYHLGTVEDSTIVTTVAGTSGIGAVTYDSATEQLADGIIAGIMNVKQNSAYDASVVIMNPADYLAALKAKDANKQYIGGGYFSGAYGNGGYAMPTSIWGVPVFCNSNITAGTAIVAARQAVKIWRKDGLDVKLYEQNEDDALYNRVTLLAEERLACAVVDLKGVCKVAAAT